MEVTSQPAHINKGGTGADPGSRRGGGVRTGI